AVGAKTVASDFKRLTRLLQGFLEVSADTHDFAHRLHLKSESPIGTVELVKVPARDFHDDIVDSRFKVRRRCAGDGVLQLVEVITNGKLGSDFGDGIAGRLRGERG